MAKTRKPSPRLSKWDVRPCQRRYTDEEVIGAVQQLAAEVGPSLSLREFCRRVGCGPTMINQRFGGWLPLRERAGLSRTRSYTLAGRVYNRDMILEKFKAAVQHFGRYVLKDEFLHYAGMSNNTIVAYWGSWRQLREAAGVPPRRPRFRQIPEYDLMKELQRVEKQLQHFPTSREIDAHCRFCYPTYQQRYRTIDNLRRRYSVFFFEHIRKILAEFKRRGVEVPPDIARQLALLKVPGK